jgi:hypothetical protein
MKHNASLLIAAMLPVVGSLAAGNFRPASNAPQ